jgi:hypothetical protein
MIRTQGAGIKGWRLAHARREICWVLAAASVAGKRVRTNLLAL